MHTVTGTESFPTRLNRVGDLPLSYSFELTNYNLSTQDRALLSLRRAKDIATAYNLTYEDIKNLSQSFWDMHVDPIMLSDGAATTLLTIQLNLVAGTIANCLDQRRDLAPLLEDLLQFRLCGQFCLTEVDHGLDAINLETTASALPDNEGYILHTPHLGAAKFMPPTIPNGIPCVAIVFAKLVVDGENHGVLPFLVPLNDGQNMSPGVTARLLPPRGGTNQVNHSITSFDHVHLPPSALLISGGPASPERQRLRFLQSIWRVSIGSLSLAAIAIPNLAISAFVCARYSQRRTVKAIGSSPKQGEKGRPEMRRFALINFKTTQTPILVALARSFVLKAFYNVAVASFKDEAVDFRVRHGMAAAMKVVGIQHVQEANLELSERCGAQGLFQHNIMSLLLSEQRGIAIAEGDLLGISIRLASELLLGHYALPPSVHPEGLLALHETSLLARVRTALTQTSSIPAAERFNRLVLPNCQPIVEAIGLRMAYEAALDAGIDDAATELYLCAAMKRDAAWYAEHAGITGDVLFAREEQALQRAVPKLDEWLDASGVEKYIKSPIVSEERWDKFVQGLQVYAPL